MNIRYLMSMSAVLLASTGVTTAQAGMIYGHDARFVENSGYIQLVSAEAVEAKAEAFVSNLTNQGIGFLSDSAASPAQQKESFRKLLNSNFDMNTIARFSLGSNWKQASKAQRSEYMKLFNKMIVNVYSQRFSEYEGQEIQVVGSRSQNERDVLVNSILKQTSGPDVKVDWRVRQRNGKFRVVDIIVEGVSMALTQRSDFSSVIQRGGGDIEALLAHLRKS